jgi:two-component system LytT family response regulator
VEYIHSDLAGVHVFSAKQAGVTQLTLRTLEEKTTFLRCHRQYMINPDQVAEIQLLENGGAEVITRAQQRIPVSRRYLKPLKQSLNIP